jgi:hypothetical protein
MTDQLDDQAQRRREPDARTARGDQAPTAQPDPDPDDRHRTGYFDSSMGYPSGEYGGGSLNPFTYRRPDAPATAEASVNDPAPADDHATGEGADDQRRKK